MLIDLCNLFTPLLRQVDWSARCETPAGSAGQVRLLRAHCAEEAHRTPRGKRASWSGNNDFQGATQFAKQPL
jgi:hypothetical protein